MKTVEDFLLELKERVIKSEGQYPYGVHLDGKLVNRESVCLIEMLFDMGAMKGETKANKTKQKKKN